MGTPRDFQQKADVLRKATAAEPISHYGKRLSIHPDFAAAVGKKRAAFTEVRRRLRRCPDVKYGLLYAATLTVTAPAGEQGGALHVRPRETEGE